MNKKTKKVLKYTLGGWVIFTLVANVGRDSVPFIPALSAITPVVSVEQGSGYVKLESHRSLTIHDAISDLFD